ncbi:MAG: hypothetical protein ACRD50_09675 [Candidatus Acidiferrales bacterium]
MFESRIPALRFQPLITVAVFAAGLLGAWYAGHWIAGEQLGTLELAVAAIAVVAVSVSILRNWRSGFYLFLIWLLFEDLVRKYQGNNMAIYFAKDVLVGIVYISFVVTARRKGEPMFRPPFVIWVSLFFWLAVIQMFNPNSPSVLYGLLGLKLYFYYLPLMFIGYALVRDDNDMIRFLVFNLGIAAVICVLGVTQAVVGPEFLNPANLAPDIRELSTLYRYTPSTGEAVYIAPSVFVSSGRYSAYLIFAAIMSYGAAGYLLLYTRRGRMLIFAAIGIITVAILMCGARGAVVYSGATAVVLSVGFLWGAPWKWQQAHRLVKAIRRSFVMVALGLAVMIWIFPALAGPRWAFYSETLSPTSSASELEFRAWDYPLANLQLAFTDPHWVTGNGTGTVSLGVQYVERFVKVKPADPGVENGYGDLIVEMGILGPVLWIIWTAALLISAAKVVRRLRETRYFPVGFAILWYAFLLLVPFTYGSLAMYQNYILNAYLWLLLGMLFRLPQLAAAPRPMATVPTRGAKRARWWSI